ncbi:MAG: type IX secretion system membrane protein PorP/SprF [Prevotellaceae bacterium]|jgi:type IX secretion system PorP/SprF family membrane protein|nr:type IX secretion system membrane protein PorP/SprF [Prevotellaceae bacterium]
MKIRIAFMLLLLAPCARAQQEVQLSQYMFNGLTLNPALAGSYEALNAQALYRMQWVGFDGAPRSEVASVDGLITQSNSMGWGLSLVGEQVGLMKTMGAYASYSYRVRLNQLDDRLSLGLSLGAMQERFGGVAAGGYSNNGLPLYDDADDVLAPETRWRPDFRVGAYYNYGKIAYAGLSASNLGSFISLQPDSLHLNNPHIYLNGGYHHYFTDEWKLSPSLLARYTLNENPVVDGNVAVSYNDKAWIGVGVRMVLPLNGQQSNLNNALAIMAEVWVTQSLRLGYCYDYAMSRLSGVQSGSHEVSVGFTLARKVVVAKDPRSFKAIDN